MDTKRGIIQNIIFHNDSNGYSVLLFETEDEQFVAVGNMPDCHRGSEYELTGDFTVNPKYGEQFAFDGYEQKLPETVDGIWAFLTSGFIKGVGPKTATAMVEKFGTETLNIIENQPDRLTEITGIGSKKADDIYEGYRAHREFSKIAVYFGNFGIPVTQIMKLYEIYGSDTIAIVEENPYGMIADVPSIGFAKADAIAMKLGFDMDSYVRIKGGVVYVLNMMTNEGHVFYPRKKLVEKVAQALDVPGEKVDECIEDLVFDGYLRLDNLENRTVVYPDYNFVAERRVALNLSILRNAEVASININCDPESLIAMTESRKGITLSEEQKRAVISSIANGVSVITGGPGTGKTTIINSIIEILIQGGLSTAIAAPTGRAAKRIEETSGYHAMTIHRLLEYYYDEGYGGMRFGRDMDNPLEYDAIIIDEASMIDLFLMDGLLSALKPGTRLIMVGDADQLPSVGVGNVLRDIIDSEYIYCTELTEIFRQAAESLIVVNAHRINHGEYPEYNERDSEFFFVRRHTEKDMLENIKSLYSKRLPDYYSECIPVRDIQVLTPVRKGLLGVNSMNRELQTLMNPPSSDKEERTYGDRIFREGDKVMQIKNNYNLKWKRMDDFSEGEGVFNGDLGFIEHIDNEYKQLTVRFDDEKYVTYEFSQLEELELAYAVTVHKSQGSEFPIVIMPVSWFPPLLATRNLLYTAVTRAKEAVVLVGSEDKLQAMVDNTTINRRYSGLGVRLGNMLNG